ncbi:hypothetical protein VNO78_06327 [Psophocarpus tetragonolobus]|uniref:Uncharacterized protein n=1 Tax=Psophocarpus tetragonolobus TaxID=3891 RepID=A0AAN9XRQ0_PSOTE
MFAEKTLDPDVDGIDETLIAYKIHHAAWRKRVNGPTNWHEVVGVREGFEDIESVRKQCNKLIEMINPRKNASVATWGAYRLVYKAWSNLCECYPKKQNVNLSNQRKHGSKVVKRACPRCGKWCKYEVPKVSSDHKHGSHCTGESVLIIITCSSCSCKFDPKSCQAPNSLFPRLQYEHV